MPTTKDKMKLLEKNLKDILKEFRNPVKETLVKQAKEELASTLYDKQYVDVIFGDISYLEYLNADIHKKFCIARRNFVKVLKNFRGFKSNGEKIRTGYMENITLENTIKFIWYGPEFLEFRNTFDAKVASRLTNFTNICAEYIKEVEGADKEEDYIKNKIVKQLIEYIKNTLTPEEQFYVLFRKPFVYYGDKRVEEIESYERDERYLEMVNLEFKEAITQVKRYYNSDIKMDRIIEEDLFEDRLLYKNKINTDIEALSYREALSVNNISLKNLARNLTRNAINSKENLKEELKTIPKGFKFRGTKALEELDNLSENDLKIIKKLMTY